MPPKRVSDIFWGGRQAHTKKYGSCNKLNCRTFFVLGVCYMSDWQGLLLETMPSRDRGRRSQGGRRSQTKVALPTFQLASAENKVIKGQSDLFSSKKVFEKNLHFLHQAKKTPIKPDVFGCSIGCRIFLLSGIILHQQHRFGRFRAPFRVVWRRMQEGKVCHTNVFVKLNEQSQFTCTLP